MHSTIHRICASALVALIAAACSSDKGGNTTPDGGGGGGGKGTGGHSATGGSESGGSSDMMCSASTDGNGPGCRACLAKSCCDKFTECLGNATCSTALTAHLTCFAKPGSDPSDCFSTFSRTLNGDSGSGIQPLPACIILQCSAACGGPQAV